MSGSRDSGRADLAALLALVADGDRTALRSIYVRLANRLFGLAVAIVRDRVVAADVLQHGFVLIWQQARQFNPRLETAEAWMAAIVRHSALDAARTSGRERPLDHAAFDEFAVDADALDLLQTSAAGQVLRTALAMLDPDQRHAVVLAYANGLSVPELAARRGHPLERVALALRQGIAALHATVP